MYPPIECRGSFFAATARFKPHGVGHLFYGISQGNLVVYKESGKTNAMGFSFGFLLALPSCFLVLHDAFLKP